MASRVSSCRFCGSDELEHSENKGELLCCRCGAVLEESAIVEGLQFAESSSGGMMMVGQFIPSCGAGRSVGVTFGGGETREQVLQRGYNNIQYIADHLRLPSQHVSSAHRLYLMATQRNFTVGRRGVLVASACLYAICRRERTPHLLIDFCDVLRVSVRALGQVFMKLVRVLHVQVPNIDPSLFMERFAWQMPLGEKAYVVAQTGVRLIQAMTRDWISTGRRPMGLCGAALLIAARYHGIQLNPEDIAHVVRVSSPTLMKRLNEFKLTATAQLPARDFTDTDLLTLPGLSQPPCFSKSRRKSQLALTTACTDAPLPVHSHVSDVQTHTVTDDGCHSSAPEMRLRNDIRNENPTPSEIAELAGQMVCAVEKGVVEVSAEDEEGNDEANARSQNERERVTFATVVSSRCDSNSNTSGTGSSGETQDEYNGEVNKNGREDSMLPTADKTLVSNSNPNRPFVDVDQRDPLRSMESCCQDRGGLNFECTIDPLQDVATETVTDDSIGEMLLSEQERRAKALIWDDLTKDIMPEVHRRMRQRRRRQSELELNQNKRRKSHRTNSAEIVAAASSAAESVRMALQKSGRSVADKINDEVLDALFATRRVVEK